MTQITHEPFLTSDRSYLGHPRTTGYGAWLDGEPSTPHQRNWIALADFALQHFYEPDLEALRMVAAVVLSHYVIPEKAIWLFLLGDSGGGKTTLFIEPFATCPVVQVMSKITPKSFLSAAGDGSNGLLHRTGPSGIWLFKDFTTITTMCPRDKTDIMATLREVWDGTVSNDTGASAQRRDWKGKITCVAVGTPAVERAWEHNRSFGERFLGLRLRDPRDRKAQTIAAIRQRSRGAEILQGLTRYANTVVTTALNTWNPRVSPEMPSAYEDYFYSLAEVVAQFRTAVHRDSSPQRTIVEVDRPEKTTRTPQSLWAFTVAHARLFGRTEPSQPDLRAAMRLAIESIPQRRAILFNLIPLNGNVVSRELQQTMDLTKVPFKENIGNLEALGLIEELKFSGDDQTYLQWTHKARELLQPILALQNQA